MNQRQRGDPGHALYATGLRGREQAGDRATVGLSFDAEAKVQQS